MPFEDGFALPEANPVGKIITGKRFVELTNERLQALLENHISEERPDYLEEGALWVTPNNRLFLFDGTDDIPILVRVGVPATPTSPGVPHSVAFSADHMYVCIAFNTWRRIPLQTW